VTGNALASYNGTSVTDGGTGIAAAVFTVGFSGINYAVHVTVERTTTALLVADQRFVHARSASQLITSVTADCHDGTATTSLVKDPTAWHFVGCGDQV
jgi:hypothetical protein